MSEVVVRNNTGPMHPFEFCGREGFGVCVCVVCSVHVVCKLRPLIWLGWWQGGGDDDAHG